MLDSVLKINMCVTAYMLAVIWIIQLIQYPLFVHLDVDRFSESHSRHTYMMGFLVGPVMVVEAIAGIYIYVIRQDFLAALNFFLLMSLWICTFLVSVPLHRKLALEYKQQLIEQLIKTNWPRTLLWSMKFILAVSL